MCLYACHLLIENESLMTPVDYLSPKGGAVRLLQTVRHVDKKLFIECHKFFFCSYFNTNTSSYVIAYVIID